MAVTALDLITDALLGMGVYAPGEPLTAADSSFCLQRLNTMIDSWSNEALMTFAILEQSGTLIPGQWQYTIGTGGNFNMTRPLRILASPGSCYVQDSNGNRYNLEVVPRDRWNLIGNIAKVTANFPNTLFYDPQYPLGIINVYPIPNVGWTLYFDSYLQLSEFAALTTAMSLPPGYQAAIQDNLTVELWRFFKPDGAQIPPSTLAIAARSKGNVKRTNMRENLANYDSELVSRANGSYNIYTGSYRGGAL
jgi:hypothetical protein